MSYLIQWLHVIRELSRFEYTFENMIETHSVNHHD